MASIADVFFTALLDDARLQADVKRAGDKAGQGLGGRVGDGLKKGLAGAAIGTLFTTAIESGVKFEDQLRTINTVAKVSDDQLNQIGNDIQQLSRDSGKTTDDLTAGFYDLVSAGIPAGDAIKVLKDSAILATGALGTTGESVDLVTSILGAYGKNASESARSTDIWAQAVADGKTTVADLSKSIGALAPIAASAGIEEEELAAATALVTLSGASASEAMTQMRSSISALLTPNAALNAIQERTKINFAELAKEKGLAVALEELRKATNGNNEEFAKALGSTEALNFAFQVTGDNAGAMATELGKVEAGADKGGVALEQYAEKSKSAAEQGKRLVANIQTFLQDVGGPFVSSVGPAVFAVNQLGQAFGASGIAAKVFGGLIGGLATKGLKPLKTFLKFEALGLASIFGNALDAGISGGNFLVNGIKKMWAKVAANSAVQGAISKAGDVMGSRLGKVAAGAFAGFLILEAARTFAEVSNQMQSQLAALKKQGDDFAKNATREQLEQARAGLEQQLHELETADIGELIFGKSAAKAVGAKAARDAIAAIDAQLAQTPPTAFAGKIADDLNKGTPIVASSATKLGAAINDGLERGLVSSDIAARAHRLANLAAGEVADGINEKRSTVDQAWTDLLDGLDNAMSVTAETARLVGQLTSKELIKGLHSGDPAVRDQARATKQIILDRLAELKPRAGTLSKEAMAELKKGMKSKDPEIRAAATQIYNSVVHKLDDVPPKAKTYGVQTGKNFASGIESAKHAVEIAASHLAGAAGSYLKPGSPTEKGPLSTLGGSEGWGELIGKQFSKGLSAFLPNFAQVLGGSLSLPTFQPASLGASVSLPMAGASPYLGAGAPISPSAGNTYIYETKIDGLLEAKNPLQVAVALSRIGERDSLNALRTTPR